jgi:phosphoglycolate phosphatase
VLIVFDLDGTLVDSLRDLTDASNELLAHYGAPALDDEVIGGMVGEGAAKLVRRMLDVRGLSVPLPEALSTFLAFYDQRLVNYTRPYDGMPETLRQLAPHSSLAVLTNKPEAAAERILIELRLRGFFQWVVGGDGPHGRKPSPEGLYAIMAWAQHEPVQTVLVGDSAIDVQTAQNAGTRMCLAKYGFGFRNCPPAALNGDVMAVSQPRELPQLLSGARR